MPVTTVTTAVTALRERLDEPTASTWSDVFLRRCLNEGIREIARRTFHWTDVDTIAVTIPSTGLYTLSDDVIRVNDVYFAPTADSTRLIPLENRAWDAMNQIWWDYQNRVQGGDPQFVASYGYAPTTQLKLFPVPYRAGTLHVYVARMPADLDIATGAGNIDMPTGWVEVCYDYAEYMALRKDRQMDVAMQAKAAFDEKLATMIQNGDYLNAPGEFIWDGPYGVPGWIADPNW